MPLIRILPSGLRNRISAGEVIERPASVAKELIENSIDAASTEIRIEVSYGGKRLIKVSDNGVGMDREDALLCFERHGTSKLLSEEDLFSIRTMGFRGEALPSIASVSKIRLTTGLRGSRHGTEVVLDGGELEETKDAPAVGTIVEVRDLFFNTPARKKFLKANSTELFHIIDTVTKEALAHWRTGFTLISDNRETIKVSPASGPRERIMQIYGEEFLAGLTETRAAEEGFEAVCFISKDGHFRNTKSHQFIFVNGRPVKDFTISHAVYDAYGGSLPREKHPIFFLFLEVDSGKIDVNVHPAKREVRFDNRERVHDFVSRCAKAGMGYRERLPHESMPQTTTQYSDPVPAASFATSSFPSSPSAIAENMTLSYGATPPVIYLGETFIALSDGGGLTLIDHHAAHERILYEKFLKGIDVLSHHLLFPRQVRVSAKEYEVLLTHAELVNEFGIELEDFGQQTVMVRALPGEMKDADIASVLSELASCLLEGIPAGKSMKEALAARIACHGSVRGERILRPEECASLLSDLEKTEDPDRCPHGRPTRIFISLQELRRMFKRK